MESQNLGDHRYWSKTHMSSLRINKPLQLLLGLLQHPEEPLIVLLNREEADSSMVFIFTSMS